MLVMLVIAVLLTLISFSLINNTVRLGIYERRFTINVMKLVGASWSFIRKPFLSIAVLEGLIAGALAICRQLPCAGYFRSDPKAGWRR